MGLREIIENHLSAEELNRVDLSEINFTHGIDFHDSASNISFIVLGSWYEELKLKGDSVRIMTEDHIMRELKVRNKEDYSIRLMGQYPEQFIVIELSW